MQAVISVLAGSIHNFNENVHLLKNNDFLKYYLRPIKAIFLLFLKKLYTGCYKKDTTIFLKTGI